MLYLFAISVVCLQGITGDCQRSLGIAIHELMNLWNEKIIYSVKPAQENSSKDSERNRSIKNKNRFLRRLDVGALVLVLLLDKSNVKRWHGPYKVMEKRTEVDYIIEKEGMSKLVHVDLLRKFGQRTMTNELDQKEDKEMHIVCNVIESNAITRENTQKAEFCSEIPNVHKERLRVMVEEEYKDVITTELGHTDRL